MRNLGAKWSISSYPSYGTVAEKTDFQVYHGTDTLVLVQKPGKIGFSYLRDTES
jgi:hypothetical protein